MHNKQHLHWLLCYRLYIAPYQFWQQVLNDVLLLENPVSFHGWFSCGFAVILPQSMLPWHFLNYAFLELFLLLLSSHNYFLSTFLYCTLLLLAPCSERCSSPCKSCKLSRMVFLLICSNFAAVDAAMAFFKLCFP